MTTLRTLAEQVREKLSADRQGSRYHILELIKVVGQVRDTAIRLDYYAQINENEREIAPELLSYKEDVKVVQVAGTKKFYVELPWQPLRLPRNAGLFKISPSCDPHLAFIPARPGDLALLHNHAAFNTDGIPSYRVEEKKVKFTGSMQKYPKVDFAIIRASDTFEEDEELTLPNDMEEQIVLRAYEQLAKRFPEDKVIDNSDQL